MNKKTQGDEDMASRDIISLVAHQWAQTSETEKQMWQFRADQMGIASAAHYEEEEMPELPNDGGGKKRARKPRGVGAAAEENTVV